MRRRLRSRAGGGQPDGGMSEGGLADGGLPDGGLPDGGLPDGGLPRGGRPPGGRPDAGLPERARVDRRRAYWRANLRLIGVMLLVWAVATFGISFFARDLTFSFFGWPFAFFVGAQGAPVLYLLLVVIYAWRMSVLDRHHGVSDEVAPFDGDTRDVSERPR